MKSSTIKLALNAKIKDYLKSITDDKVRQIAADNILCCGGAIASMLSNEKVNDYDIYFKSFDAVKAIAEYYTNVFNTEKGELATSAAASCNPYVVVRDCENIRGETEKRVLIYVKSAGVASETQSEYHYFEQQSERSADEFVSAAFTNDDGEIIEEVSANDAVEAVYREPDVNTAVEMNEILKKNKGAYRPVFFTDNAITLSDKVQLVLRFYGSAEEIHRNYDFAHAMCCYDYKRNSLVLHPDALESILGRNLVYRGSLYPIASLFRIRKFMKRGWSITAGQMLKIVWQVNELDLKDSNVLKEQLLGVDQAYMHQLIHALQHKEAHVKVDSAYIAKIVDEIFD